MKASLMSTCPGPSLAGRCTGGMASDSCIVFLALGCFLVRCNGCDRSDRKPLDRVPGELLRPAVVRPLCPRIGVSQKLLNVFQRNPIEQEIGGGRHADRVRRELAGKPGVIKSAFSHSADINVQSGERSVRPTTSQKKGLPPVRRGTQCPDESDVSIPFRSPRPQPALHVTMTLNSHGQISLHCN